MNVKEAMQKRRSVRKFTSDVVEKEKIDELLHAAMSGPSACNKKPWEFYVITNEEKLHQLRGASHYSKIDAKLAIVVCGNLSHALPMQLASYWIQDCSAATENILLQATELGLGTVWCGLHPQKTPEKKVAEILELPDKQIPLGLIYIGYPDETPDERDQYDEARVHYIE